ncbi:hypothetical protein BpHYR1_020335, partial [Brachionus plicatilis]
TIDLLITKLFISLVFSTLAVFDIGFIIDQDLNFTKLALNLSIKQKLTIFWPKLNLPCSFRQFYLILRKTTNFFKLVNSEKNMIKQ